MDRLNCAQKVLAASRERFAVSDELIERFGEYGGGRAPQGWCGALYAAKVLLEKEDPSRFAECERTFIAAAGAATCSRIRALRKLSCAGCVDTMTAALRACGKEASK